MSPDRTTFVVFDPESRARSSTGPSSASPSLLWTRQLNAIDWSTEGRTAPTVHHTVHQGLRPEAITQEMLALYGDRVDRTLLPERARRRRVVVTSSMPDLDVVAECASWRMDDFPSVADLRAPRPGGRPVEEPLRRLGPGGHDGWVVVPVDERRRLPRRGVRRRRRRRGPDRHRGEAGHDGAVRAALGVDARVVRRPGDGASATASPTSSTASASCPTTSPRWPHEVADDLRTERALRLTADVTGCRWSRRPSSLGCERLIGSASPVGGSTTWQVR